MPLPQLEAPIEKQFQEEAAKLTYTTVYQASAIYEALVKAYLLGTNELSLEDLIKEA